LLNGENPFDTFDLPLDQEECYKKIEEIKSSFDPSIIGMAIVRIERCQNEPWYRSKQFQLMFVFMYTIECELEERDLSKALESIGEFTTREGERLS
jgi:hypothetical protein